MKTRNIFLSALGLLAVTSVSAQSTALGVQWTESSASNIQIVQVNPDNPMNVSVLSEEYIGAGRHYVPNTFHHIKETNTVYFLTDGGPSITQGVKTGLINQPSSQRLVIADATTGKIQNELPFQNTAVVAPVIIPEKNRIGFISTKRTFNSYGNNDDDVSLVIFDLGNGEIVHKIKLSMLSFDGVPTPFVGKMEGTTNTNQTNNAISLSSPCYISSLSKIVFTAKDVMGANRVFTVNTESGVLESKLGIEVDVLDMAFDAKSNTLRTLFIREEAGVRYLSLGDMKVNGNQITNQVDIRMLSNDEKIVFDGSIEVDEESSNVYISKVNGTKQVYYTYDADNNFVVQDEKETENGQLDFEFAAPFNPSGNLNLANIITLYPNPASDVVTVATDAITVVSRVTIVNSVGQEVKDVLVQSGSLTNDLDVSKLKPGIYMVTIESSAAETVTKKLIIQ